MLRTVAAMLGCAAFAAVGFHAPLHAADAPTTWSGLLDERPALAQAPFHFLMMTSGLALDGAKEADTQYRAYLSRTQKVGIAIPILYMRTTLGKAGDWRFDPDFDLSRKCGNRLVAEDNLAGVIRYAIEKQMPVQFILNGGISANSVARSRGGT